MSVENDLIARERAMRSSCVELGSVASRSRISMVRGWTREVEAVEGVVEGVFERVADAGVERRRLGGERRGANDA